MSDARQEFLADCRRVAKGILEEASKSAYIQVFSHMDADGIAAGSIIARALQRTHATFTLRIIKDITPELIEQVNKEQWDAVVFTEIGSGYLDLISKISRPRTFVIDHHKPLTVETSTITHVNPCIHGYDGASEVSGSTVSYFVAKELNPDNRDSAALAVVGALGDMQDRNKTRSLTGLNELAAKDAVEEGVLDTVTDLTLYGRETRPLHRAIAATINPFMPGLSGDEDGCLQFLSDIGIPPKKDGGWRTISDLSMEERQKVFSELTMYLTRKGLSSDRILSLIGSVYTLSKEEKGTPLRDGREFATLLNACSKLERTGVAVALCVGERGQTLTEAQEILTEYRRSLAQHLSALMDTPDRILEFDSSYVIKCEGIVNEKLLSPVATMISTSGLFKPEKPLLVTTKTHDGQVKISARAHESLISKGVHLGAILQERAEKVGGRGGGHDVAAGATIPSDGEDAFMKLFDEAIHAIAQSNQSADP